ncbi:MAG: MotA/TolQ/ExbB proton channel family protein [Candidatus Symbiothrix sp.]|jgi:biopolymer transport protein ExbB|nr:MotA/TolQ/ExbB proton channel family protein [Candidatus Symbiothrix sp.]
MENELGLFQIIKTKFIEGNPYFMGVLALLLVIGLAFCVERIIYIYLSRINAKKLLADIDALLQQGDVEGAKRLAQNTRGPVASLCYQALMRINEDGETIDKAITAYGSVQVGLLEKNLSWITLFIAVAPGLGFLGTVMGMIESFDEIQAFGDINPSIVAGGMKFALITTVGGLIVAVILQFFYNFILTRIEKLTGEMEDSAITLTDMILQYKRR